jgi:hypothetical protein
MNGRSPVSLGKKHLFYNQKGLANCFPMRTELLFKGNMAYSSGFSWVRNITFVQNSYIQVIGRIPLSLVRKPFVLETGRSSTFFPMKLSFLLKGMIPTSQGFQV